MSMSFLLFLGLPLTLLPKNPINFFALSSELLLNEVKIRTVGTVIPGGPNITSNVRNSVLPRTLDVFGMNQNLVDS